MTALPPPPIKTPFLDSRTGLVTAPWLQWFRQFYDRSGGALGSDPHAISDSAPPPAEIDWGAFGMIQGLALTPAPDLPKSFADDLTPGCNCDGLIADLTKRVEALEAKP